MTRPTFRPILVSLLVAVAVGASRPPEAMAQDCPSDGGQRIVLTLPDDQESLSCTIVDWGSRDQVAYQFEDAFLISATGFLISGSGLIEVIFTLEERIEDDLPAWFDLAAGDRTAVGNLYRVVLQDPDSEPMVMHLLLTGLAGQSREAAAMYTVGNEADLKVLVRRLPMQCSMWARVTGDVTGTFYGDVAYYLTSTDGIIVDPEAMAMFGLLMGEDMAGDFAKFLGEELGADQKKEGDETEEGDEKKEGDETGGGESFALVLQDFKLDQELDDPFAVAGMLLGQFSLTITAALVPSEDPERADLLISHVGATVGAVGDGGDRILFENTGEEPSKPVLTIFQHGETDLAYGTFSGDLATRKHYSLGGAPSRQLNIHIDANYSALRGQFTCAKR